MRYGWWLVLMVGLSRVAGAATLADELRAVLERLQTEGLWGEVVLQDGRLRSIQVESLGCDSVLVREVIGPLYERRTAYALADFQEVRELGLRRIPREESLLYPGKSLVRALALETLVPGAGFLYAGDVQQGLTLVGLAAAVAATGVFSSGRAAAGWAPLAAWVRIASWLHLRDEVRAMNQAGRSPGRGGGSSQFVPLGQYLRQPDPGD